ncbi:MAG: CoB--CoM heterodisulfide reductase iron-sulfur subunit B family protein [Pelotomaculum sp.]|uniref:Heterodisulfide reductase, subunit B n=1 Tax=Pelotomaculum thermopropionicum (strain DSM 13744 / JCM 10971 / SI) TaxID=370438 RepID=A5D2F1_PELTS|nr:CoB--CoM heterodisulfide reductase iron-sulfur subunit B family protein [Pelotomaculum sp.]BAF59593.1 heterodisulfide reductase, subunit B [Pelotomaculum thermopropionicum SI]
MKYAYYPGCSYHTSGKEYEASTRVVAKNLGLELVEIPDWSCCGATAAHGKSHLLNVALPARNLALAEEMGLDVTTPCASCYQQLAYANKCMIEDKKLKEKVNQVTGKTYNGTLKVKSIVEVIGSIAPEYIKAQIVKPLKGLKIAAYYGCLLVRPPKVTNFDDAENPMFLDNIMRLAGAETLDWPHKTECCGGSLAVSNLDIVVKMLNRIIKAAVECGANCFVVACPLCHFNLDMHQKSCNKMLGTSYTIPVFYFTQLLGLAMGLNQQDLQLGSHFTDTQKVLSMVG